MVDKAKLETVPRPVLRSLPILDLWGHLCAALLSSRTFVRETLNNFSACSCHIVVLYSTSFCSFPHPARASEGRNFGLRPSELWESGFLPFPPWVPFLPRSFVIGCLCVFFPSPTLYPPYLRPRSCLPRRSSGGLLMRTRRTPRSMAIPLHTLADVFLAAS